ncbi:MAG: Uma2 family endonuclease [Deltaproteobacteria bacterium]|nr:Uma2 family endonuclease [Deltaproteobacteria bacterium]
MTTESRPMKVIDPYPPVPPPGQDDLPYDDGEPMDTPRHRQQMNLLIDTLADAWADRDDVFVGGDMFVYYSMLQTKQNDFRGPDVFVVLGAIPQSQRRRKSWVVWEENGKLPDLVIELTSPTTERVDHGEKKRIYEQVWHLPEYFCFDPDTKRLEGWRLEGTAFVRIDPLPNGDLPSRVLALHLGIRDGCVREDETQWLRWIDPATGQALPTEAERRSAETARADAETARADAEAARANAEAARADALAREIDALKRRIAGEE